MNQLDYNVIRNFDNYMLYSISYGDPTNLNLAALGWRINYISHTFLNGWINYVKPISAYVVHRYADDVQDIISSIKNWEENPPFHTNLKFNDDIVMLCKSKSNGQYWYFWFDNDVSDCSIGKLNTLGDSEEDIIKSFTKYVEIVAKDLADYHSGEPAYFPLDVSKFSGWIEF